MRFPMTVPSANGSRAALLRWPAGVFALVAILTAASAADAPPATGADAYVRRDGDTWTLGTSAVQRRVTLADGKLQTTSFTDPATGRELMQPSAPAAVFSFRTGPGARLLSSAAGEWKLISAGTTRGKQGELQLDLAVQQDALKVTKTYVLYPGSSIIREWVAVTNAGPTAVRLSEPRFLQFAVAPGDAAARQFHWMSGAEDHPGSWVLKTLTPRAGVPNQFDSYDPFPVIATTFPGDGVDARIELNGKVIWPADGKEWQYIANATVTVPFDLNADVAAGDRIAFRVNMHGNSGHDTTDFEPTVAYADGESHRAARDFTGEQGKNGWRYQYVEAGTTHDLVYDAGGNKWRKKIGDEIPFVDATGQHPAANQDAERVWTATRAGRVRVTGSATNSANGGGSRRAPRPGSSSYAPWYALYANDTRQGVFVGFDYFGHWSSRFDTGANGATSGELTVAGDLPTLAPGQTFTTPSGFVGLYHDDLDHAGNALLDWQYAYLWDYTRDGGTKSDNWFPALRTLGYWMRGTNWGKPGNSWSAGTPDMPSTFRKVFRVADYMRYTGTDVYHRDWGWWDVAGDWNGPDFRTTGDYLRKSGMGQLIYAFIYTVNGRSKIAQAHPEWLIGNTEDKTLDMSQPAVVAYLKSQLDDFVRRWGDFEWRCDGFFTSQRDGDDAPLPAQDTAFREVIRHFLDTHPGCAFQACNGGGNCAGYDYARYASNIQFSDGAIGLLRNHWSSLLFPPDKNCDNPDQWNPDLYDKATWRGLLTMNYDTTGDTADPQKLEGVRLLNDIYHYLLSQGVVGRWVHVYRPAVEGDEPTMWFERLSRDARRGIIIPKRAPAGALTVKPRGLLANEHYVVSYQESDASEERSGADLMERGIAFTKMPPGELIYLNLPLHPGNKVDKQAPTPPSDVRVSAADNMGYPGVELTWKPGADETWVSHYEIFRGGAAIDKVAKGTYYFDHSLGADARVPYEVRTVDGAGNVSGKAVGPVSGGKPATVLDDAEFKLRGTWQRQTHVPPAHAGTICESDRKGDTAELSFEGKRVVLVVKLGPKGGKAAVSFDGADGAGETFDTFTADDIWGVGIYRHDFATAGKHTMRVTVLGEHDPLSTGTAVALDGVRVEHE